MSGKCYQTYGMQRKDTRFARRSGVSSDEKEMTRSAEPRVQMTQVTVSMKTADMMSRVSTHTGMDENVLVIEAIRLGLGVLNTN